MPVEIRIFDPPTVARPTFGNVGRVMAATGVSLVERHYTHGSFSIGIPAEARHADKLVDGRLVRIGESFWGIIDDTDLNASATGDVLTISGRQLKGLTIDRITIPPNATTVTGAQGYDAVTGSTEAVMKHYVQANMCNPAQPSRVVFGLEIALDWGRGVPEDKYMSRHKPLSDELSALGEAAALGYDIVPDLVRGKLVFDVVAGEDHTAIQNQRTRVIFELRRKTALSQQYVRKTADSRNLFYATMAGSEFADETMTVTYLREGEVEPVGIYRRETHLNLSGDTPTPGEEYNELKRLALIEAENYRMAESFQCEIASEGRYLYGRDYALGDLVTVQNQDWGVTMHTRLIEMQTEYSSAGIVRTATFGRSPLNIVGRLKRQIARGV